MFVVISKLLCLLFYILIPLNCFKQGLHIEMYGLLGDDPQKTGALQNSYPVFRNMITEPVPQINQETQQPQKDAQGRILMIDANNRKAYVNPNNPNDYVEVQEQ